jgi:hypothetical protein
MIMNIFIENKLYPNGEDSILSNFAGFYDSVFIAYLPFFRLKEHNPDKLSVKKSHQISLEEFKAGDDVFSNLPNFNANVYSYENDEYPEDEMIFEKAETVGWEEVKIGANFSDHSEIYKALKTSIGSYRKVFERVDLYEKLMAFTEKAKVYHPSEGNFEVLSKIELYKSLKRLGKNEIVVVDEFYESEKELDLTFVELKEFVEKVEYKDYYIYAKDKSVLFTIEWDSFFYLICSDKKTIDEILRESKIEGFFCTIENKHTWEWDEVELMKLLENESRTEKKSLWKKFKNVLINK